MRPIHPQALNWPIFLRRLYGANVALTPDHRLASIAPCVGCEAGRRVGGGLRVTLVNEYSHAPLQVRANVCKVEIREGSVYVRAASLSRGCARRCSAMSMRWSSSTARCLWTSSTWSYARSPAIRASST